MLDCFSRSGQLYRVGLLLGILLLTGCGSNEAEPPAKPNILLILVDDLGNNDIASWGDGQAPTPTLDHLSQQSVRFRHHYTDSTCSPSRAALLTGRRAVEVGFQPNGLGLSSDLPTLPKSLKTLGYHTAHIGKWHVGEALEYPEIQPGNQGFDYWLGFLNHFVLQGPGPDGAILRRRPTHIDPWLQENGQPPKQHTGYLDDLLVDKAIELIENNDEQPWFINLWLFSPHTPYQPAPKFRARFPETPEGIYLAVLSQLDHNIARLQEALKRTGKANNTIVVIASDNGGLNQGRDNNFPLQGKKATYLEGGVRSPLLIQWPSHLKPADIQQITDITDIYPTLVTMAGGHLSEQLPGHDLGPLLRGERLPAARQSLFWASDAGPLGMTYAGVLFDKTQAFYRDLSGTISIHVITPAIGLTYPMSAPPPFDARQSDTLIKDWERKARRVPVHWTESAHNGAGYLSGRDFQRAPIFAGYSLGLALKGSVIKSDEQALVHQEGVWSLSLNEDQRLRLLFGNVELLSDPVDFQGECNTLVASFDVQPASGYPFPAPDRSRAILYLNGQAVLDSPQLLSRPQSAAPLANPTYIGRRADGANQYRGDIGPPILINKMLLPKQDGYQLQDMLEELCNESQP